MKILCTGANGMLSEAIRKEFMGKHELIATDIFDMDVRDIYEVRRKIKETMPSAILHLAAETDLEICERRPDHAYFTNTIGTQNIAIAALEEGAIPIVYMSTAGIFDGQQKEAYSEHDRANPINHYGRSKYYGELALHYYPNKYILRMSWAMGGGPKLDKKFVNAIYQQVKRGKKQIYAVDDKLGSPTYTRDVAKTIKRFLENRQPHGIYHVAGKGVTTRCEVAKAIVELMKSDAEVIAVQSKVFDSKYFAPRATNEGMVSIMTPPSVSAMRGWRESLEDYLKEYYND